MFLTCPQCDTTFSAPDEAILPDGAKVRCSECKHVWFQEPVTEEDSAEDILEGTSEETADESISPDDIDSLFAEDAAESDAEDSANFAEVLANSEEGVPENDPENTSDAALEEDIPESLKSGPDEDMIAIDPKNSGKFNLSKASLAGYGGAILLFILILITAILIRPMIVTSFPGANSFYALIGIKPAVPSKSILFHEIITTTKGDVLHVRGSLINLSKNTVAVPMIAVIQLDKDGHEVMLNIIPPPVPELKAEETRAFEFKQQREESTVEVKLSLTLKEDKKTAHEEASHSEEPAHNSHDAKASPAHAPAPSDHHSSPAH